MPRRSSHRCAFWSIGVGTAISARSSDVRVAQQLGTLASLPPLAVTALVSFQVVPLGVWTAVGFGLGLLVIDLADGASWPPSTGSG